MKKVRWVSVLTILTACIPLLAPAAGVAAGKITLSKVAWSARSGLTIRGSTKGVTTATEIFDLNGRRLGTAQNGRISLRLAPPDLPTIPCGIRVQAGEIERQVAVMGAPKSCRKPVACSILSPAPGAAARVGDSLSFKASVKGKRPVFPVKYDWDFAGGAMGHPSGTLAASGEASATAVFIRDNSAYRVRFAATDALGRRCEDSVEVAIGTPPARIPARIADNGSPKLGSELDGKAGDVVVLPAEEWSYQCINDHYNQPNINTTFPWAINNLGAAVYRKDRLPPVLDGTQVNLRYLAASNPSDPNNPGSINSTSQNWPLGAYIREADIAKTDLWERVDRRGATDLAGDYVSRYWIWQYTGGTFGYPNGTPVPDEGMIKQDLNPGHGSYMPGISNPYLANDSQEFSAFVADRNQHLARFIPITDVDDQGRINPYPLLRVQALDKGNKQVLAETDAVMTTGRDLHCRECHAKGQIAANPAAPWTKEAYHSSLNGADCAKYPEPSQDKGDGTGGCIPLTPDAWSKPEFVDPRDGTYQEQEWAALINIEKLHDFYDYAGVYISEHNHSEDGLRHDDGSFACDGCHFSPIRNWPASSAAQPFELWGEYFSHEKYGSDTTIYFARSETNAMHGLHGRFQKNPDGSLQRDGHGKPLLWDVGNGRNPNSLFPVVDAQNRSLPMEQNCLRCHSGQREQCYRDRMYTAGVTCFDCHGDMQAMGLQHKKPENLKTADGNNYRVAWYEEPDCGSCHTGDANSGKDGSNGFFSAGVLKRAFADDDLSSTPLKPRGPRFAVLPVLSHVLPQEDASNGNASSTMNLTTALYRDGKDTHGNVPCASCHGGAHAVWPNRDPSANDNVTALQLQGHTGNILECNVCHTADAFKNEADLDGGQYSGDPITGILGGPHNLHPVNDPYWWKSTEGDTPNADGTTYGGWHNNYARKPDKNGKDQCAACHGDDHQGTRLSKTPVDREFSFRGMNAAKLKKVGIKSRVVKVAAGTPIGCDTCHRLDLSFTGSPGKAADRVEARLTR